MHTKLTPHLHYSLTQVEHGTARQGMARLEINCSVNQSSHAEPGPAARRGGLARVGPGWDTI